MNLPKGTNIIDPPTPDRGKEIESFMWDGINLKLYSAQDYDRLLTQMELCWFCWRHGLYQLPTTELISYLKQWMIERNILPSDMMEIGAGAGQIGRHLGIRMTDSKIQDSPEIGAYMSIFRQPTVKYSPDVLKIEGDAAVVIYRPRVVLACWVTEWPRLAWGVHEEQIMELIEHYIFIGNKITHVDKKSIGTKEGDYYPWIKSRSFNPDQNRIWILK